MVINSIKTDANMSKKNKIYLKLTMMDKDYQKFKQFSYIPTINLKEVDFVPFYASVFVFILLIYSTIEC